MASHKDKKKEENTHVENISGIINLKVWNRANASVSLTQKLQRGTVREILYTECISTFPRKSYMEMNHQLSICFAIFHQVHDGNNLENPRKCHTSSQPALSILKMVEMGTPMVDFTALPWYVLKWLQIKHEILLSNFNSQKL